MPEAATIKAERGAGLDAGIVYLVAAIVLGGAAFGINAFEERNRAARVVAPPALPAAPAPAPSVQATGTIPDPAPRADSQAVPAPPPPPQAQHCETRARMSAPATLGGADAAEPPPLPALLLAPCLVTDQPDEIWTGARPPPRTLGGGPAPATDTGGIALAAPVARDPRGERRVTLEPPYLMLDGGTLRTATLTVRLAGVDALAAEQVCLDERDLPWACGLQARAALHNATRTRRLVCDVTEWEGVDRATARCAVEGRDLALAMIAAGFARPAGEDALALAAAEEARVAVRGAWRGGFRKRGG